MRKYGLLCILIFATSALLAQKMPKLGESREVVINTDEQFIVATVFGETLEMDVDDHVHYYWFSVNKITCTRGGYSGKLLHGRYTEYYPQNKNLKEMGEFRYGAKTGVWKTWYEHGELWTMCEWKKGRQHGDYQIFNSSGQLTSSGTFHKGYMHGLTTNFRNDSIVDQVWYENGQQMTTYPGGKKAFRKELRQSKGNFWERLKNTFRPRRKKV